MINKKLSKTIKNEAIDKIYENFWSLYNSMPKNNFRIRDKFKNRIIDRHYKDQTLNKLLVGIKWFISNYDLNRYYCTYVYLGNKVPYINIYNFNDCKNSLYEYTIIKNEVILINDLTNTSNIKQ
jgi:hypothetical protein